MELLTNPVQRYAWGSHSVLSELQGRPSPTEQPEAEIWVGAHPSASSRLTRGSEVFLREVIANDPRAELGMAGFAQFGANLPFLSKFLVAERPLSIQVHPNAAQAAAGFDRENAAGLDHSDPRRNYRDPHHKPELLCAITEFEGLYGFRPASEAAAMLDELGLPALRRYSLALTAAPDGPREVFTELVTAESVAELVDLVAAAVRRTAHGSGRFGVDLAVIADIAERFPGDRGIVLSLLLNHVRLAPGEAVFVPAGMPHAHLRGFGVEVMADSDNVVRCGLTPKHIDVDELLALIAWDFDHVKPLVSTQLAPGVLRWAPPVSEFMLTQVSLGPKASMAFVEQGPQLVLCLSGEPLVGDGADELRLGSGQAAYSSASAGPVRVSGEGIVFIVGPGR